MVSKRGRPKKENVARYPCGKIDLRSDPRARDVGEWNGMKEMVKHHALNPAWTCQLWRLHHEGKLFSHQREAGDRYYELVKRYRNTINAPAPTAKVSKLERGYGRIEIDPEVLDVEQRKEYQDHLEKIQGQYDKLWKHLVERHSGIAITRALNHLVIDDLAPVGYEQFLLAKEGLKLLAEYFCLTAGVKSD